MQKRIGFLLFFLSITFVTLQAQSLSQQNYTSAQANASVSMAANYIVAINQSTYLIFSPNLTSAYSYLGKAQSLYNSSPIAAVAYAQLATNAAASSYSQIGYYRNISAIFMILLTVLAGALLYKFGATRKKGATKTR